MFGVVLWSDMRDKKAVIWCEDHGDLAYYSQPERSEQAAFDAGDWVQFDLSMVGTCRMALNPRLIAEGVYAALAESLDAGGATDQKSGKPGGRRRDTDAANVIPFSPSKEVLNDVAPARALRKTLFAAQ